jgi:hypothetical protein
MHVTNRAPNIEERKKANSSDTFGTCYFLPSVRVRVELEGDGREKQKGLVPEFPPFRLPPAPYTPFGSIIQYCNMCAPHNTVPGTVL